MIVVQLAPDTVSVHSARRRAEAMAFLFPWIIVRVRAPAVYVVARQAP